MHIHCILRDVFKSQTLNYWTWIIPYNTLLNCQQNNILKFHININTNAVQYLQIYKYIFTMIKIKYLMANCSVRIGKIAASKHGLCLQVVFEIIWSPFEGGL